MTFADPIALYHVIKHCWSRETACGSFDPMVPSRNQCAVTALAVQHHFGGDIFKTATKGGTHFYNLVDGQFWDLSAEQFDEPIPYDNSPSSALEASDHAAADQVAAILRMIETHCSNGKST